MASDCSKDKVTLDEIDQSICVGVPIYSMQGDGVSGTHALAISFAQTSATQTISCYFRTGTNTLVQLAIDSYFEPLANFNLANGAITRQRSRNLDATITSGPNGCYRYSLTFTSSLARSFLIYLITSPTTARDQLNTTTGNILVAAPQLELALSPTIKIPRGVVSVTREADVIRDDFNLSVFQLYGSRDFTGSLGRDVVDGVDGAPGAPGKDILDGVDGATGALGRDGVDGVDGMDGAPGELGWDGGDGADGMEIRSTRPGRRGRRSRRNRSGGTFHHVEHPRESTRMD